MKSKKRKNARAPGLRVVGAAASGPAAASAPAQSPGPEPAGEVVDLSAAISDEQRIAEQQKLIDNHRAQRSELIARQAKETADLIKRHLEEEKALERGHTVDVAKLWRRHGRELGGWQVRALGGEA